jgi:hypothetical protein
LYDDDDNDDDDDDDDKDKDNNNEGNNATMIATVCKDSNDNAPGMRLRNADSIPVLVSSPSMAPQHAACNLKDDKHNKAARRRMTWGVQGIVGTDGRVLPEQPCACDVVPSPRDGNPTGWYRRRGTNATAADNGPRHRSRGHSHSLCNLHKRTIL